MRATTANPTERCAALPDSPLSGGELLALQLIARGYTPTQIDQLATLADESEVFLRRATLALGVQTPGKAVAAAKRRGLIV